MSYDEDFATEECMRNGATIRNDSMISHSEFLNSILGTKIYLIIFFQGVIKSDKWYLFA